MFFFSFRHLKDKEKMLMFLRLTQKHKLFLFFLFLHEIYFGELWETRQKHETNRGSCSRVYRLEFRPGLDLV